jgi:transposase InsO family protein
MCKIAKVSKSGYYKWLRNKDKISFREILDYTLVKDLFFKGKGVRGIRRIKMDLEDIHGKIMNRKKISRIMNELNLRTKTRKQNPYKQRMKDNSEKFYCENLLQREFKNKLPYKALGIDITYLKYNGRFAYLCVLLDVKTTEVISYALSQTMTKELTIGTIEAGLEIIKGNSYSTIIHSDRGSQFTSKEYKDLLLAHGLTQSMSAPASPRDNAVIESFFGHLKDEICLKGIKTFDQVISLIDDYMYYYNNERRQWNKNRMTPIEYRKFLLAS